MIQSKLGPDSQAVTAGVWVWCSSPLVLGLNPFAAVYVNLSTTKKTREFRNILAHCTKYYHEKCDFCWRHSGVPLHWITVSIWNLLFRISPIFEGQENRLPEAPICKYKNNKTTSENISAHCAKYYYEKCNFCWRHSVVPLHWITISIWNLLFRISPMFEGHPFASIKITRLLQKIF